MTSFPPRGDWYEPEPPSWPDIPSYVPTWLLDTPAPASPPTGVPRLPPAGRRGWPGTGSDEQTRDLDDGPGHHWHDEPDHDRHDEPDDPWLDEPWLDEPRDPRQRALYHLWREEPSHLWEPDAQLPGSDLAVFRADPPAPRADASIRSDTHPLHPDPGPTPSQSPAHSASADTAATQVRDPSQPPVPDTGSAAALIPSQEVRPGTARPVGVGGCRAARRTALPGRRPGRHRHRPTVTPTSVPTRSPLAVHSSGRPSPVAMTRRTAILAGAGGVLAAIVATCLPVLLPGPLLDGASPWLPAVLAALVTGGALAGHRVLTRRRGRRSSGAPGAPDSPG